MLCTNDGYRYYGIGITEGDNITHVTLFYITRFSLAKVKSGFVDVRRCFRSFNF